MTSESFHISPDNLHPLNPGGVVCIVPDSVQLINRCHGEEETGSCLLLASKQTW